jgi:thiamine biosynthesis lipoprotein
MDRRDFLQPEQIARAAGQMLGALHETPAPRPADEITLLRFGRRAMAATFEVFLSIAVPDAMSLAEAALDEVARLEEQLTVFHDHSEVSRLNRNAYHSPVVVEERLFRLLGLSARLHQETSGAFDITTGALTRAWGFYRRQGRLPSPEERAAAKEQVGMTHVALDAERRSVRYRRPGLEVNLGSIGKGYALDRAAEILRDHCGVSSALLHGGQSSVLAIGTEPGSGRGWPVGIRHPWKRDQRLAVVRLRDRGLATSGATFQHLEYNGRKLGHILDPRTGWPAEGMASATVIAPSAAEADALSTAFFILGAEAACAYCESHPGIAAVLLPEGLDATPVVIGLAREEIDLYPPIADAPGSPK